MAALGTSQSTARDLLRPEVLSHLKNLDLVARSVVEGFLIGLHRSPKFGFSQEFAEYRSYNEGDDPRFIDWNVYARSEKMVIKRFLGETNSHLMFLSIEPYRRFVWFSPLLKHGLFGPRIRA